MRGYPFRTPRCRVCGSPAFAGTQARPLCVFHDAQEKEIHELLTAPAAPPHAQKMHEQAQALRVEADQLDRYAEAKVVFAHPCPDGLANHCTCEGYPCRILARERYQVSEEECACKLPDESCRVCDAKAAEVWIEYLEGDLR